MTPARPAALLALLALCACTVPSVPPPAVPAQPSSATGSAASEPQAEPAPPAGTGSAVIDERLLPSGMAEVGAANAPVSLTLFTNAECGYCRDFHEDLLPRLMNDYVRTGRVRLAVSPFIVRKYAGSEATALAQICAARQGKGMAMQDLLFRERVDTPAYRTALAAMEVDQNELARCVDDASARAVMDARQAAAAALGVTLIPSYVIQDRLYTGLPDYPDLRGQIEEALTAPAQSR